MSNSLDSKIKDVKDVLDSMPRNNLKNKNKYRDYVLNILEKYNKFYHDLYLEIIRRRDDILGKVKDYDGTLDKKMINDYYKKLLMVNDRNTPYEKSGLDKILYEILHFYKDDFEGVNKDIRSAIEIFGLVGIKLQERDFCYSPYVNEYMTMFMKSDGEDDSLRECFDKLYWKCPDIIVHIGLNFKYLYYKNEKLFSKYFCNYKNDFLKSESLNYNEVFSKYKVLVNDNNVNYLKSEDNLIKSFVSKKYNILDYSKDKILKYHMQLGSNSGDIDNIKKFLDLLVEYKNYFEYKYIIDDIKKLYKDKDKFKSSFRNKLKEIAKIEAKIIKLNKKIGFRAKFNIYSNKIDKLMIEINSNIKEVSKLYNELEIDKFKEYVSKLEDNVSLYDILLIASSYYIYLRSCIDNNFDGLSDIEINDKIVNMQEFLFSSDINVINNISIVEDRDVSLIISDRYKLLRYNITKDEIENNVLGLIELTKKIILGSILDNCNIDYEDILFLCNVRDIIK